MITILKPSFWRYNWKRAFSYFPAIAYLLRKKGLRAAYNFIFAKLFVKHGEGSWGIGFVFIDLLLKVFPRLTPLFAFYPFNIEVEITTRCNKRCILCEHTYWQEEARDLSFEEFKGIVDQFPGLKWINMVGEGDDFLNKDFLKMVEYVKRKDVCVYLVDSFDLIDKNIARKLVELGVNGIYISFDAASKEVYEKIKVGCSFERVVGNIKNLIEVKRQLRSPIPELCFRYVFTALNVSEMPRFIEFVHSLGDKSLIEFVGLLKFNEVKHLYLAKVPQGILDETLREARELSVEIYFTHSDESEKQPMEYCSAWFEPYIIMGGYVLPCCAVLQNNDRQTLRKYALGNIFQASFKEIWYSQRYKDFRHTVSNAKVRVPILCKDCRVFDTRYRQEKYGVLL